VLATAGEVIEQLFGAFISWRRQSVLQQKWPASMVENDRSDGGSVRNHATRHPSSALDVPVLIAPRSAAVAVAAMTFAKGADLYPISAAV
jgi:hypothetical protein